jgi:putative acyl-CoA dehydrogenase
MNQAPPLENYNLFTSDRVLTRTLGDDPELRAFGERLGRAETLRLGFDANEHPPVLHTHDRFGARRDEVTFHPAYHELMRLSIEAGLHASPWTPGGSHVRRVVGAYLISQVEAAHFCPVSMTYSAIPALRQEPEVAREWEPAIVRPAYDPSFQPAGGKRGLTIGMGMTEKQGGSDVRANITTAVRTSDGSYVLNGHKWFCSAPMCDAFLILAQAEAGLTCFLLPRWRPDGARNGFHLQRLKNKLGNRANASSEVEFHDAWAVRIGEEGRGVRTIMEMVNCTRLDCVMGAAAIMRAALVQAIHHCRHRRAFGRLLMDQPLMQSVLTELALEVEIATRVMLRLARAYDAGERAFARLATALAKFWVTKRTTAVIGECLECLGGNGYVEDSGLPRLYREAPLNGIWEGSGNVIALDVLRAVRRDEESVEAFAAETGVRPRPGDGDESYARLQANTWMEAWIEVLLERESDDESLALFRSMQSKRIFGTAARPSRARIEAAFPE